jgi:hypothetical protein
MRQETCGFFPMRNYSFLLSSLLASTPFLAIEIVSRFSSLFHAAMAAKRQMETAISTALGLPLSQ